MSDFCRLANGRSVLPPIDLVRPFSNFDFLEQHPGWSSASLERMFSQARRGSCKTLIVEQIDPVAEIADEISSLQAVDSSYSCEGIWRLSFLEPRVQDITEIDSIPDDSLRGYVIIKIDSTSAGSGEKKSHVFESVFVKYDHLHNFVPGSAIFHVRCGPRIFKIPGVMYCQQDGRNKACAQVALRSLLSTSFPNRVISYSEINNVAGVSTPSRGLSSKQIRKVLEHFQVSFADLDYEAPQEEGKRADLRKRIPYHRFIYSGMESGMGGLVGFRFAGQDSRHIIPFFGHTFNQDTWAPRASNAYFRVGPKTQYIPSDEWVSSFIGHDDNFGSNFCIPRKFIAPEQVEYVVNLLPATIHGTPLTAEARAIEFLGQILPQITPIPAWGKRWQQHVKWHRDIVARPLLLSKEKYVNHIKGVSDWNNNSEDASQFQKIEHLLPDNFWVVEMSLPELYSANYSKLGELVLTLDTKSKNIEFAILRIPGQYFLKIPNLPDKLFSLQSSFDSHIPLFTHSGILSFDNEQC